jgi:hypothetical protein
MNIKRGLSAKIVTEIDPAADRVRVGDSMVYEVWETTIVLAQTAPPIPKSMLHREVIISYLVWEKTDMVRYGFPAQVMELIDYSLNTGEQVKALVVNRTGEAIPYSIRMFYRVDPTAQSRLNMYVQNSSVNILDISLGGARFSFRKPLVLQSNAVVEVRLGIDDQFHGLKAHILRIWSGEGQGFSRHLSFASVEFLDISKTTEHALSRKIRDIERESLSKKVPR